MKVQAYEERYWGSVAKQLVVFRYFLRGDLRRPSVLVPAKAILRELETFT